MANGFRFISNWNCDLLNQDINGCVILSNQAEQIRVIIMEKNYCFIFYFLYVC